MTGTFPVTEQRGPVDHHPSTSIAVMTERESVVTDEESGVTGEAPVEKKGLDKPRKATSEGVTGMTGRFWSGRDSYKPCVLSEKMPIHVPY